MNFGQHLVNSKISRASLMLASGAEALLYNPSFGQVTGQLPVKFPPPLVKFVPLFKAVLLFGSKTASFILKLSMPSVPAMLRELLMARLNTTPVLHHFFLGVVRTLGEYFTIAPGVLSQHPSSKQCPQKQLMPSLTSFAWLSRYRFLTQHRDSIDTVT
mmetsp:Transcript_5993/g.11227  ORF Transcript_5993/g.11227 Transcript_5993/m.11227 type:complete len:158 (-) Transcript_5993:1158-1631(-)